MVIFLLYNIEPGLSAPLHEVLCDPEIFPCDVGSCRPCILGEKELVKQYDCTNSNDCTEVTKRKIELPPSIWTNRPPHIHNPNDCMFCFWKMNLY